MTNQLSNVICPYCNSPAELVGGKEIYPRRFDLYSLKFWQCKPCKAYVGCHKPDCGYGDGTVPLGRLANEELRGAKSIAHATFDKIWKVKRLMKRKDAYKWLSQQLNIPREECHIGMFDVSTCDKVVEVSNLYLKANSK